MRRIIRFLLLPIAMLFGGCAPAITQIPVTGQRAFYHVEEMRHFMQDGPRSAPTMETIRMVTVVNPSNEDDIFLCDDTFRVTVPSGTASTFRLDDRDVHCDLQNDTLYSPNTGAQ